MFAQSLPTFSLLLLGCLAAPLSAQWEISQSRESNRLGATVKSAEEQDSRGNSHVSELVFFIDGNKVWTGALITQTDLHSIDSIVTESTDPHGRPRIRKMRFWNIRKGTGMKDRSVLLFSIAFPDLKSISKLKDQSLLATSVNRQGKIDSHTFTLDQCAETVDTIEGAIRRLGLGIYLR